MATTLATVGRLVAAGAGVGLVGLGYRVWAGHDRSAADTFAGLLAVVGIAALCTALLSHQRLAYKLIWLYAFLGIPMVFARFGFDYYGIDYVVSRSGWVAVTPPAIAAVAGSFLVLGTPSMIDGSTAPVAALASFPEPVLEVAIALRDIGMYYASGLMLVAIGLVLRTVFRYDHLQRGLGVALSFVGVWPWIAYVISPELTTVVGTGGSLAVIAGCYVTSLGAGLLAYRRYDVLDTAPAAGNAAPERVLDAIADGVIVVTTDNRVLRINGTACRQFGVDERAAIGAPLVDVIGIDDGDLAGKDSVELPTPNGTRSFELTTSDIADRAGNSQGKAIVCRDVTQRETREQRLQVLNRVMRHNLRNDMTGILGRADLITDGGEGAVAEHATRIKSTARDLVSIGERAREVERMMSLPERPTETTAIEPVLSEVTAELGEEYPTVEITTAVGANLRAGVNEATLVIVLRNLIENACRHNDADEPIVVVTAERSDDGTAAIAIADNGPGIADHERRPIEAGSESQLEHGSGLGLWTAHWGIRRMGGDLSFAENDPRGTVVRIDLPTPPDAV